MTDRDPGGPRGRMPAGHALRLVLSLFTVLGALLALSPASVTAADPPTVVLSSSKNPSIETIPFTLTATVSPVPAAGRIQIQVSIDGGSWGQRAEQDMDPSGTTTFPMNGFVTYQTYRFRAVLVDINGALVATSTPIDQVIVQRPTSITMTLDAPSYPFRTSPVAHVHVTDVGVDWHVSVQIQRPNGTRFADISPVRGVAGQTDLAIELTANATWTPGQYQAVADFGAVAGGWAGGRSDPVPFTITEMPTSTTLSTARLSTSSSDDFVVTVKVTGAGGAAIPVGSVLLRIDGLVDVSGSVADGRASLLIDTNVRQRFGNFGILVDGRHTLQAFYTFRANGGYSASKSGTLVHFMGQQLGPVGSVAIYGGAAWAAVPGITMSVAASDALEGVASVRIANAPAVDANGVLKNGDTFPYKQTLAWSLDTLPCQSCPGAQRTVYVQWMDKAGNWSGVSSDSIGLDITPPAMGGPAIAIDAAPVVAGRVPVKVTWSATDGHSGIARYEVQVSHNGGAYAAVSVTPATGVLLRADLVAGDQYQYRVRAFDQAGNRSAWTSTPLGKPALVGEGAAGTAYTGAWTSLTGARYLDGSATTSTVTDAAGSRSSRADARRGAALRHARHGTLGRAERHGRA